MKYPYPQSNVIFHTVQEETSHFPPRNCAGIHLYMEVNEYFRKRLAEERQRQGLSAAELSRRAGLNARAVTDIEEGRAQSPKISTVFALAAALCLDPGDLIGLGPRASLESELVAFLSQYDAETQKRLLAALLAIAPEPRV